MKNVNFLVAGLLVAVLVVSGCIGQTGTGNQGNTTNTIEPSAGNVIVDVSANGFSPETVTIKKGAKVTWRNIGGGLYWIASGQHPTHTIYPGVKYSDGRSYQGSLGCIAEGQSKEGAFDSCKGIGIGEAFEFTFNYVGKWSYHNHLNPSIQGTVIVVE